MYTYIKGKITNIESNYISLENNGIGYHINTPNPYVFNMNEEYIIYIYQHVREDEISLYGFKNKEDKDMFLRLIEVKGVGCKMALPMLATGSIEGIIDAIERENILYLKKFPKIGDKVARQIILDLKGKFKDVVNIKVSHSNLDELSDVLKGLGYKQPDINRVLPSINSDKKIEEQIKEALKLLLK
jgi:holliday junction DNA helicase RuvA